MSAEPLYDIIVNIITRKTPIKRQPAARLTAVCVAVNDYINCHTNLKFDMFEDAFSLCKNISLLINYRKECYKIANQTTKKYNRQDIKIMHQLTKHIEHGIYQIVTDKSFTKQNDDRQLAIYRQYIKIIRRFIVC